MNQSFFNTSELQNVASGGSRSRKCGACKLYKNSTTPKMEASGAGKKGILIIAESIGGMEDKQGIRNIGKPGRYLKKVLKGLDIDIDEDCRKISAVNCMTEPKKKPTDLEIDCCRPMIYKEIDEFKPKLIILLGSSAVKSFYSGKWKKSIGGIEKWRGWQIPDRECQAWICPTFHPSFVQKEKNPAAQVIFERDLRKAIRLLRKPVPQFKDEASCIDIIKRPSLIEKKLNDIYALYSEGLIAFDYETTGLKPNAKGHKLISCSIATSPIDCCSFPIHQENIPILKRILENPKILKSAHDLKFETRWSYFKANSTVQGWFWDSQLAAHIIDNRRSSTSLKFQALINFGLLDYDSHISHFLAGVDDKDANSLNRIEEAPVDDVLLYGGIDSIIGYRLTMEQLPLIKRRYQLAYNLFHDGNVSLSEAEKYGMAVDEDYCQRKDKHLARQIERLRQQIEDSQEIKLWKRKFGKRYNPESNEQLASVLFDSKDKGGLGLESIKETASGKPSTDQGALESLEFPFVKRFIELKKLIKIKSTNFGGFIRETVDGILRPFFHLNRVITFRSSSSNINFQNIPNRIEWIKKLCRKAIVARAGRMIMGTDYGGIEVKVSACYHKDPVMLKYLNDPTTDMHRDQAMEIFMIDDPNEVTKQTRYTAKNGFIFPQFYGDYFGSNAKACWSNITSLKLETKSGVGMKQHLKKHGITTFDKFLNHMEEVERVFWEDKFSVYNQWKKDWVKAYHEKGYCDSLTGFRFQGLMQENDIINYPVQGAAFHCLVWSINEITRVIKEWESKFIGQIHDEKVDEVDPLELNQLVKLTDKIMCHDIKEAWDWIIVPLEAEFQITGVGGSFYDKKELHKYKIDCPCKTEFCWKREESNYVVYTCPICEKEETTNER